MILQTSHHSPQQQINSHDNCIGYDNLLSITLLSFILLSVTKNAILLNIAKLNTILFSATILNAILLKPNFT
jgi:hypothetical protein